MKRRSLSSGVLWRLLMWTLVAGNAWEGHVTGGRSGMLVSTAIALFCVAWILRPWWFLWFPFLGRFANEPAIQVFGWGGLILGWAQSVIWRSMS